MFNTLLENDFKDKAHKYFKIVSGNYLNSFLIVYYYEARNQLILPIFPLTKSIYKSYITKITQVKTLEFFAVVCMYS